MSKKVDFLTWSLFQDDRGHELRFELQLAFRRGRLQRDEKGCRARRELVPAPHPDQPHHLVTDRKSPNSGDDRG